MVILQNLYTRLEKDEKVGSSKSTQLALRNLGLAVAHTSLVYVWLRVQYGVNSTSI